MVQYYDAITQALSACHECIGSMEGGCMHVPPQNFGLGPIMQLHVFVYTSCRQRARVTHHSTNKISFYSCICVHQYSILYAGLIAGVCCVDSTVVTQTAVAGLSTNINIPLCSRARRRGTILVHQRHYVRIVQYTSPGLSLYPSGKWLHSTHHPCCCRGAEWYSVSMCYL